MLREKLGTQWVDIDYIGERMWTSNILLSHFQPTVGNESVLGLIGASCGMSHRLPLLRNGACPSCNPSAGTSSVFHTRGYKPNTLEEMEMMNF